MLQCAVLSVLCSVQCTLLHTKRCTAHYKHTAHSKLQHNSRLDPSKTCLQYLYETKKGWMKWLSQKCAVCCVFGKQFSTNFYLITSVWEGVGWLWKGVGWPRKGVGWPREGVRGPKEGVRLSKEGEIWTRIAGFKVQSANHYTIGPICACGRSQAPPEHMMVIVNTKKKLCFLPGSNRRPCACEAHVITATLRKLTSHTDQTIELL